MKLQVVIIRLFFLLSISAALPTTVGAQENFDIIISGGRIVDGSGNPWYEADIGIVGERITRIGNLSQANANTRINATGLTVSPGFIDPHTHALRGIFDVPNAESALLQGVTTLTEGNDGSSPFPIADHYADIAELGISPNWSVFVGQGTIRSLVIGEEDREATEAELERMKAMVRQAMEFPPACSMCPAVLRPLRKLSNYQKKPPPMTAFISPICGKRPISYLIQYKKLFELVKKPIFRYR